MTFTEKALLARQKGFNIYLMTNLFYKRFKVNQKLPIEVIEEVLDQFLSNPQIDHTFPYFLTVLKEKSRRYFSNKNIQEHQAIKDEPMVFKNILKRLIA